MSKLAQIQTFRNAPAAGGLLSFIPKLLGGAVNAVTGLNIIKPKSTAPATAPSIAAAAPQSAAVKALMGGGSFGGAKRRSKGITGRELRGFRKVAKLLHKEGMVSKKSRGR